MWHFDFSVFGAPLINNYVAEPPFSQPRVCVGVSVMCVCACHCVQSSAIIRVLGCVNLQFKLQKRSIQTKAEDCTHVNLCCFVAAEYSLRVDGGFPTLHVVSIVRLSQLNSNGRYLFKRSLDSYFFSLPSSDKHCWPPRVLGCVMAKSCLRV